VYTGLAGSFANKGDPMMHRREFLRGAVLVASLAKEAGRYEKELRYPGEDDIYENPKMDALNL
jgi:hypothetical protein